MINSGNAGRSLTPADARRADPPVFDPLFPPRPSTLGTWNDYADAAAMDRALTALNAKTVADQEAVHHIPAQGGQYDLGTEDRPWRSVASRSVSVRGTQTLQDGVFQMHRNSVMEFARNESLMVLPVYDKGISPYDIWHPSSSYYRDGGFWIQKGSPGAAKVRLMGVDRMVGVWDTTTGNKQGSVLLERPHPTDGYGVTFSSNQHPDDYHLLGLSMTATCSFGDVVVEGALLADAEPMYAYASDSTFSGSDVGSFWFEDDTDGGSGDVNVCYVAKDGFTYKVAMSVT